MPQSSSREQTLPAASGGGDSEAIFALDAVIGGPLPKIAQRFSRFLAPRWPHQALVIFTRECTGRPRKVAGAAEIVDLVTIGELETIKQHAEVGVLASTNAVIGGALRRSWVVLDATGTLLVLIARARGTHSVDGDSADLLRAWFAVVATSIRQQVAQASPDYLAESRAASSERARTIAQLTQSHEDVLTSVLGTLRSRDLDDRTARITASQTASTALIALRSVGDVDRELANEAVASAFGKLRAELEPQLRQSATDVDFILSGSDDHALPGEIAHAARAIVRAITTAFMAQRQVRRLRIAWECQGDELVIDVRDQCPDRLDLDALTRQLAGRLQALDGGLDAESVPAWGARVTAQIPLATPRERHNEDLLSALNPRELEVLGHLARGRRNKSIASALGVSESTVKFHVTAILHKLKVSNRGEAGLLAANAGIVAG